MNARSDKLFSRRKRTSSKHLQRKPPIRVARKRVLIAVEGSTTEPRYFRSLVHHLSLTTVDIEICGECDSAPISVVNFIEEKCKKEGLPLEGGYSAAFAVFDRDTHSTYEKALSRIYDLNKNQKFPTNEIKAIPSIPCIEYWFLLHFIYSRKPYTSCGKKSAAEKVIEELKTYGTFKKYDKKITEEQLEELTSKCDEAEENSRNALSDAEKTGEPNPTTLLHDLITDLKKLCKDAPPTTPH